MIDFNTLKKAMGDLEESTVTDIMTKVIEEGGTEAVEAMRACQEGMNIVGDLFQTGEYFVGDLIFAGDLMTRAMTIIKPAVAGIAGGKIGKMIFCTVQGDLHDIGKNIVIAMLEANGFEVIDLGIDVAPETIVQSAKDNNIKIIALSGVLTLAIDSMKATVEAFNKAGMRDELKIIVGGNPVSKESCTIIGADEWAYSPQKTVNVCKGWAVELGLAK